MSLWKNETISFERWKEIRYDNGGDDGTERGSEREREGARGADRCRDTETERRQQPAAGGQTGEGDAQRLTKRVALEVPHTHTWY